MPKDATPASEAEIIARLAGRFTTSDKSIILGIGDDAAVLRSGDPGDSARRLNVSDQIVTTDLLIEGVHFDLECQSLADTGYKALAVNLSDIAAMGGKPRHAFGVLGVPRGATLAAVDSLLDGMAAAAGEEGVQLAGGDTVAAPQWVIGFTVLGEVRGPALTRTGARPGDIVWHSGRLGLSQVGLSLLWAGKVPVRGKSRKRVREPSPEALAAHRRPRAQVTLGRFLQKQQLATACLDTSDSLAQCLLAICEASGIGMSLDFTNYPFAPEVQEFTGKLRRWRGGGSCAFSVPARFNPGGKPQRCHSLAEYLLSSAEDYALLFTAPPAATPALLNSSPERLTCLGNVVAASEGRYYRAEDGKTYVLERTGFEHL